MADVKTMNFEKKEIHIINVVWGIFFLDLFLKVALPNQLTKDNLIFLSKQDNLKVIYRIYTTEQDKNTIENAEIYKQLIKYIEIEFILITLRKDDCKYSIMNHYHNEAINNAFNKNAILIFLTPDIICSNNMFKALFDCLMKGYRSVAIPGIRLDKQDFLNHLKKNLIGLELPPRKLVEIALQNLHLVSRKLYVNSKDIPSGWCPFYFKIDDKNLLVRAFHLHPLLVWPEKKSDNATPVDINIINETISSLQKVKVIEDSDELVIFELTDKTEKDIYGKFVKRSLLFLVKWCLIHTQNFNKLNIKYKTYFKSSSKEKKWKKIEKHSDKYVSKIYLSYKLYKILNRTKALLKKYKNVVQQISIKIIKPPFNVMRFFFKALKIFHPSHLQKILQKRIDYETKTAPFLAKYFFWIFWPIYKIFKVMRFCFVMNIAGGVGHIIEELDYFTRRYHLKKIDNNKRYIWIRFPDEYSDTCIELYGKYFWYAKSSFVIYELLLPILMYYKDITIDSGLSRLKWQLTEDKKYYQPLAKQTYLHQISKEESFKNHFNYINIRKKTRKFFPLMLPNNHENKELVDFIGTDKKIALVHIKEYVCNATAETTDPLTYLETLIYLEKLNFQLVFVGREKMPSVFNQFSIINYAQSQIASFENDIKLFNMASIAIICGSGLSYLADCIDLPYLYINSWHVHFCPCSPKCILIPALVLDKKNKKLLTFSHQIDLYNKLKDTGPEIFPYQKYDVKNALSDEILVGVKELLSQKDIENNILQKRMKEKHFLLHNMDTNFSNYFLKKYSKLL